MNVNEYGIRFVYSTGFDLITDADNIRITFTKPDGTLLIVETPDVTAPAVQLQTTLGLFPSGTYAQYTFIEGDVDQVGTWSARVTFDKSPSGQPDEHLISDVSTFVVNP